MKRILGILISCGLLLTGLAYCAAACDSIVVNKTVKAGWANIGSWIAIYDPSITDGNFIITQISFGDPDHEDMFRYAKNSNIVDEFISMVNKQYESGVRLLSYSKSTAMILLTYEDNTRVIWDFGEKMAPKIEGCGEDN